MDQDHNYRQLMDERDALSQDNAKLRAALEPFAWMADQYSPGAQDDFIVGVAMIRLRDARNALG